MSKDFVLDKNGNKVYEGDEVTYRDIFSMYSPIYLRGIVGKDLEFYRDGLKVSQTIKESLFQGIELNSRDFVKITENKVTYTETTLRLALMDYIKDYIKQDEVYITLAERSYINPDYPKALNIEVYLNTFTKELVTTVKGLSVDVETVVKKYESEEDLLKDIKNKWTHYYLLSLHELDLYELLKIENNCTSVNYEF